MGVQYETLSMPHVAYWYCTVLHCTVLYVAWPEETPRLPRIADCMIYYCGPLVWIQLSGECTRKSVQYIPQSPNTYAAPLGLRPCPRLSAWLGGGTAVDAKAPKSLPI